MAQICSRKHPGLLSYPPPALSPLRPGLLRLLIPPGPIVPYLQRDVCSRTNVRFAHCNIGVAPLISCGIHCSTAIYRDTTSLFSDCTSIYTGYCLVALGLIVLFIIGFW